VRILVACEFSGTVRDAFRALGHDATSCDLLPTEAPGPHFQGDVLPLLREPWDLVVAHPPCTYLCNSGVRWLHSDPTRWQHMVDGAVFFRACLEANAPMAAVENPVMHGWAAKIVGQRQTQVVQPWMFGHPEKKATGLWLRGLPPLVATDDVRALMAGRPRSETDRVHYASPAPDRWKLRSATYAGLAAAMAAQWAGDAREAVA
jgi:hypothetical protein